MRFLSTKRSGNQAGFTLVEVLIIAPVVILAISGFVGLMVVMAADVLVTRDQNNLTYETQDALDLIEQDTRLAAQFLVTSQALPSPQGSNNNFTGTAAFTNTSNTLILGGLTTDKNPTDPARKIIFYAGQPNPCGNREAYNRPFLSKVIYFLKDNSLWRRVVLPDYNTNVTVDDNTVCGTPWQRNSCSPGYSTSTRCQTNDAEIVKDVSSFLVKYYSTPTSTSEVAAGNALAATTIEVTINGAKTTAGRNITNTAAMRATRLNSIDVDIPAPGVPDISYQINGNTATFSWPKVPLASSYALYYNINGGAWTEAIVNGLTTSYSVTTGPGDTITFHNYARNSSGSSTNGAATATIPKWYTPSLQNSWVPFDSTPPGTGGYSTPGYEKTSADVVVLKGVIKDGNVAGGTVLLTLPPGYRPAESIIFQTDSGGGPSRINVHPSGNVTVDRGSSAWIALDGIRFIASTAAYTWTGGSFQNGWTNYGAPWGNFGSTLDSIGRVHFKGLVRSGTNVNPTVVTTLPAGQQSPEYTHLPASSNALFNYTAFSSVIHAKGLPGAVDYYALQGMFYPTTSGWTTLTLQNGWQVFDTTGHSLNRYRKGADGIVTVKGLIKNGTTTAGTVVAQLPAGFRPKERLCIAGVAGAAHSRIDVLPNGQIIIGGYANSGWTSLDNVSFVAEQ